MDAASEKPVRQRASAGEIILGVLTLLVSAGYLLFALLFVVLAWTMTAGLPAGGWWWLMLAVVLVLVWHCVALGLVALRGRRWLPALVPGVVGGLVPTGLAVGLFLVPGLLLLATTGALVAVIARRR